MINHHHAISVDTIRTVAARTGVREMDVRRTILGLPIVGGRGPAVIAALVDAGCKRDFLQRLAGAAITTTKGPTP